ncbi:MAG TPA: hypothetical protein VES61_03375 [Gaiellaceae bacterium]|nr:hypothetical protein [Gaiellaceae bacterium]
MALALAIAWLVEWVSWRDAQARAAAPWPHYRRVAEEAQTLPEPEPEPKLEPETPLVVETVPDPVAVEADPEPVPVLPEAVSAPESPEPEPEPEPEPDESRSEPEASDAPAASARRGWRGMSFRWADPRDATTSREPPAPAESDPVEASEPTPVTVSELKPPVEVESPPKPEPRPRYAPPRSVPRPTPEQAVPVVPRVPANVVRMPRSAHPREWNVWELESLAREQARLEPERGEEWSYLFVHLRQFANAEGTLPSEFDGLVRESFGELLETLERA